MVERIGIRWPHEPDVSGFRPDYADVVRHRQLPFDMKDPLIFHVLTTLSGGDELLQIMRDGGSLMPASEAEERWGDESSMIFARDRIAGDNEYLFTTPCNVFAEHHEKARSNPAVAFRLNYVASVAKGMAFRVHDLEPSYKEAELLVSDPDSLGIDEEEWEDMSPEELQGQFEEEIAVAVEEQLKAIAECGTQYDTEAALQLTHLYAQLMGSFRQESMWVPADDPERVRIFSEAEFLFPECILEQDDVEWARDLFIERQIESLVESWVDLFGDPVKPFPNFPTRLLTAPSFERPELMVQGALSLCEAAFYRDQDGAWRSVPEEVCLSGRGTA